MQALPVIALALAAVLGARTTYVQPVTCEPGSSACGGLHDARFCEYRALAVQGLDSSSLGIAPSKPFCVVTTQACIDTHYSVKDRDCEVLRYDRLGDNSRDDCPQGAPMFVNRQGVLWSARSAKTGLVVSAAAGQSRRLGARHRRPPGPPASGPRARPEPPARPLPQASARWPRPARGVPVPLERGFSSSRPA